MGPVHYFPGCPYNTISLGDLKFYDFFLMVPSEPLKHFGFVEPGGVFWRSTYWTQNNFYYIQIEIFKLNPQEDSNIYPPCLCPIKTKPISAYLSALWSCLYFQDKTNGKKSTHGHFIRKSSLLVRALLYFPLDQEN